MVEEESALGFFCGLLLVSAILFSLFLLGSNNLGQTGMNYDEAASFWISQGLHNYSPVKENPKGLKEVIRHNQSSNLDPGGHSILLHFWTKLDIGIVWLRLFSFIFFLVFLIFLALLAWEWSRSYVFTALSVLLPFLFDKVIHFAFEIRAYSMEICGIVVGVYLLNRVFHNPTVKGSLLLGLILACFMSSRYSFITIVAAVIISYFTFIFSQPKEKRRQLVTNLIIMVIPIVTLGFIIFYFSFFPQINIRIGEETFVPEYYKNYVLNTKSFNGYLDILKINFLSFKAFPITISLLMLLVIRPIMNFIPKKDYLRLSLKHTKYFNQFYLLIFSVYLFSFLLSLLGIYPWNIDMKWSLYLQALSIVAVVLIVSEVIALFRVYDLMGKFRILNYFVPVTTVVVIIFLLSNSYQKAIRKYDHNSDLIPTINYLKQEQLPKRSIYVTFYEVPVVRYLYEYGNLRGDNFYPDHYKLEYPYYGVETSPIDMKEDCLSYFITGDSPGVISKRLDGYKIEKVENYSFLLKVSNQKCSQ